MNELLIQSIRVVLVGDAGSGKSCLLSALINNSYPQEYIPTIHEEHSLNIIVDGKPVALTIVDTAGHEDYDKMRHLGYLGSDVVVLVFSVINPKTFESLSKKWATELKVHRHNKPWVLVGTKADLRKDTKVVERLKERGQHPIDPKEAKKVAKEIGAKKYLEASANDGSEGIRVIFEEISRQALANKPKANRLSGAESPEAIEKGREEALAGKVAAAERGKADKAEKAAGSPAKDPKSKAKSESPAKDFTAHKEKDRTKLAPPGAAPKAKK